MTGQRLALLVAADEFADPGLASLRAPQVDVSSLAGVFEDPEIGGFTVERLVNCTSQEFRLAVNRVFAHRDPDDFVLVHVSSHGLKDPTGELFLATSDTQREHLDATAVEATYLRRQMDRSRAKAAVLLLDCCYGGAFERGMSTRSDGSVDLSTAFVAENEGRGRAVITASTAIEYAFEGAELTADQPATASVFSDAIVQGLVQGAADLDGDGQVSLGELFTFVSRRVRDQRAGQTPQWWLYGMSEELMIAHNPNPGIRARELPPDVTDVLAFPQAAARLGAVVALRELVNGEPGIALTAYQTLQTLALDDSRQVSAAASEALADVHVSVEPASLDFGEVSVGAAVPALDLTLSGSLAGACQLVVQDAPVTISRRGNHARVRLDTSAAAELDGRIELRGPGGGVTVPVRGRVAASTPTAGTEGRPASRPVRRRLPARPSPTTPAAALDPAPSPRSRPAFSNRLLIGWILAALFAIVGLVTVDPDYTDEWLFDNTWFGGVKTVLPMITIPITLLGVQLGRSRRARVVFAGGLAGTGLQPAVAVVETFQKRDTVFVTLVVLLLICLGVLVFAALRIRDLWRELPRGERRLQLVGAGLGLMMTVWSIYLINSNIKNDTDAYLTDFIISGVVSASFLVPLRPPVRLAQCGLALGAALSAVLSLSQLLVGSEEQVVRTAVLVNVAFAVVALVNLWPAWRTVPSTDAADPPAG